MVPRRRPTDTLIVLSSILKPREEMGRAFNQVPDSLVEAAMSEHETVHWEHSPTKNWPSQILWCPDPGTMTRGWNRHGANPVVQNEVGGCAGPGPRRLLPRSERSWGCVFPEIASEVDLVSPMGESNRKPDSGSVVCASGIENRMESLAVRLSPITSDFRSFRCRPRAAPSQTITSRSCLTSSAGPPMVLSSRYQTQSSDFS